MSIGCTECYRCPVLAECRQSVRSYGPNLCEPGVLPDDHPLVLRRQRRRKLGRPTGSAHDYYAVMQHLRTFTYDQLAREVGVGYTAAKNYIYRELTAGRIRPLDYRRKARVFIVTELEEIP